MCDDTWFLWESGQPAELNPGHGDADEGLCAGDCPFVVTRQSSVVHQPDKGAINKPAVWQHIESTYTVRSFDHLDGQFMAVGFAPVGECAATISAIHRLSAIHRQKAEQNKTPQNTAQERLGSIAFGLVCGNRHHSQHQTQGVQQQMGFAAFDPFFCIVTHRAAVPGGFDALTGQGRRRGMDSFSFDFLSHAAQRIVGNIPQIVAAPSAEDPIVGLPWREINGEISPLYAPFDKIEDDVKNVAQVRGLGAASGGFGQHRFEIFPLGAGRIRSVISVFHRINGGEV